MMIGTNSALEEAGKKKAGRQPEGGSRPKEDWSDYFRPASPVFGGWMPEERTWVIGVEVGGTGVLVGGTLVVVGTGVWVAAGVLVGAALLVTIRRRRS